MAVVRLLLLVVVVAAQRSGTTPPNVEPPTEQLREQHGLEHSLSLILVFLKMLIWSWCLLEGSIIFALSGYCPPALARPFLGALFPTTLTSDPSELTPAFLTGTVLTVAGAFLRVNCYRALGKHFTYQLSIRPTHALVTDGVYGIIRHPSYTGFIILASGYFLCVLDRQGPIVSVCTGLLGQNDTSHGDATVAGVLACMWATGTYTVCTLLHGRMNREDAHVGKEGALSVASWCILSGTARDACDLWRISDWYVVPDCRHMYI